MYAFITQCQNHLLSTQKKLKGLPNSLFAEVSNSTRNPVLYMEHEIAEVKSRKEKAHQQHNLCPPASALKNEFQILKFYSFTSTLVAAILSNNTRKVFFFSTLIACPFFFFVLCLSLFLCMCWNLSQSFPYAVHMSIFISLMLCSN